MIHSEVGSGRLRRFFNTDLRKVLGDSGWAMATTGVSVGLQVAETIIIARFLSPALFGVFVLITVYPESLLQFLDFRAREAMTKYLAHFMVRDEKPQAVALVKLLWLLDVSMGLVAFGLISVTATFAARLLVHDTSVEPLIILYGLGLLFASLDSASGSVLRVFDRFALSFKLTLAANVLRFFLILAAVVWGSDLASIVWARVGAELVTTILFGVASFAILKRNLWDYRRSGIQMLRGQLREIGSFLLHTNLAGTLKSVGSKLDVLIIGLFSPPAVVGIYRIATKLASVVLLVTDPLNTAIFPLLAKQYAAKGIKGMVGLASRLTILILPVAILAISLLALFTPQLIYLTVGEAYIEAAMPLQVMLLGFAPAVIFFWARPAILSTGRADILTLIGLVTTITQLGLLFLLVPQWGVIAAALALSVQYVIYVGAELGYLWRVFRRSEGSLQAA